jgi:hypothetical protein
MKNRYNLLYSFKTKSTLETTKSISKQQNVHIKLGNVVKMVYSLDNALRAKVGRPRFLLRSSGVHEYGLVRVFLMNCIM